MAHQCAVIGLGRYGTEVALCLSRRNFPVMAVDSNRDLVESISNDVDKALCFDSTSETALRDARIDEMSYVVVAIGDNHVEDSILTTALLKQVGVPRIIARASTDLHAKILRIVGATEVVNPEREMGVRTAQRIITPGLTDLIPLSEGAALAEMRVPDSFVGQSMIDLRVRSRYGVTVIAVRRTVTEVDQAEEITGAVEKQFILSPQPDQPFRLGDILVVAGKEDDVKRLATAS